MFPERLKAARIQSSLSRSQLASLLGVTKAAITRWESGSREPNFTRLVELCDALDVTCDFMLGRAETPPPESEGARVATEEPIPEEHILTDEDPEQPEMT